MFKKTSKSFVVLGGLLVFSLLLASCQSTIASNEEMERSRAIEAWGANLTAQGERYLEEMASNQAVEAWGANLTAQGERYLEEMASNQAVEAWGANLTAQGERYLEEMVSNRAVDAWGANLTAQGERYLEEMASNQAVEAWGANLTVQGERYLEEMERSSFPWIEFRSDVPAPAMEQASVSLVELGSDIPAPATEILVEAPSPEIQISRTRLAANTYLIVYTVKSNGPAWVVFHADEFGYPGQILQTVFVGTAIHKIARTEVQGAMRSEQVHVMLHEDLGRIGLFEFPGPDGPVYVDNEIVNEICFCPF